MSYEFDHEQARKRKNSESGYLADVDVENGSISREDVTWKVGTMRPLHIVGQGKRNTWLSPLLSRCKDDVSRMS